MMNMVRKGQIEGAIAIAQTLTGLPAQLVCSARVKATEALKSVRVTKTQDKTGQPLTTCNSMGPRDTLTEGCPVMSSVSLGACLSDSSPRPMPIATVAECICCNYIFVATFVRFVKPSVPMLIEPLEATPPPSR